MQVHAIDCETLVNFEEQSDRWIDLHWSEGNHAPEHIAALEITIVNDAGVLGRICTLIGEQNANISDMNFTDRKPDFYKIYLDIQVRDVEHLHNVMTAVEADSGVAQILRSRDVLRQD